MPKDEKLLKKIDRLLKLYGVEDEEQRKKFLTDVEDAKYDEEEHDENSSEEQKTEQVGTEQQEEAEETQETTTETESEEESSGEEQETESEETSNDEESSEGGETEESKSEETETGSTETTEEQETKSEEETKEEGKQADFDIEAKFEEFQKAIDGLSSRFKSIEDIVAKLGTPIEEKPIGESPAGNPVDESQDTTFDEINRKRIGY